MKEYQVTVSELEDFKWAYKGSDSWSKSGSFWVKAWVSSIQPDLKHAELIVADEKPAIIVREAAPKREAQDDEKEQWSRRDTLYGDIKRAAIIATREIDHAIEVSKTMPKPNLTLEFKDTSFLNVIEPGKVYWFSFYPRKGSLLNIVRFILSDKIEPDSRTPPTLTWADFKAERFKKRMIIAGIAAAVIYGIFHFQGGNTSVSARHPTSQTETVLNGEKSTYYPTGEVHQRVLWNNGKLVKSTTFYKDGTFAMVIIYDEKGMHKRATVHRRNGETYSDGEDSDRFYMAALLEMGEYMKKNLNGGN